MAISRLDRFAQGKIPEGGKKLSSFSKHDLYIAGKQLKRKEIDSSQAAQEVAKKLNIRDDKEIRKIAEEIDKAA